jgi:putative transposase
MKLVKQYLVKDSSEDFKELDALTFHTKNIYNATLYRWRQALIKDKKILSQHENYELLKEQNCYREIPQNVAASTFNLVQQNIKAHFCALESYEKDPSKFTGKPHLPKYKDPKKGRTVATFTTRVLPKKKAKIDGFIRFTGLNFNLKSDIPKDDICQVRFEPRDGSVVVEVVYEKNCEPKIKNNNRAAIDLGVNNLAAITSNVAEPLIINGRPLKSINQFFNKRKAALQSSLEKRAKKKAPDGAKKKWSKKLSRLQSKRNRKIKDYMHKASKKVCNFCLENKISILAIGKNDGWKQNANMNDANNQNFVQIPFEQFISMVKYKCELKGITVKTTNEAYTSVCSFLDEEAAKFHKTYKGKRVKRGLFKTAKGIKLNADINGSFSILKKAFPSICANELWDRGLVVSPKIFTPDREYIRKDKIHNFI